MPTLRLPEPGSWWSLDDVTLRADGMLLYELGPARSNRVGGRWHTDERSRTAIEAFTALPLDDLGEAIRDRLARLKPRRRPIADTWDLPGGTELRDFLLNFGPLHAGSGARFAVGNPRAEVYEQRARDAEFELGIWRDGKQPDAVRSPRRSRPWVVSFEGWAQGSPGRPPDVTESPPDHGREEPLHRFRRTQAFVVASVELADALATSEHWSSGHIARERVRDVFFAQGGRGPLRLDGSTEWRRIISGVTDDIEQVVITEDGARPAPGAGPDDRRTPMTIAPWDVDWLLAGRMLLADMIGRHVQWAQLYLGVDETGRLGSEWRTRSLEEVMYVQLMEHVRREPRGHLKKLPYWPLPICGYCDGAIVQNPRRPDGPKANRWHVGCRKAGQMREARAGTSSSHRGSHGGGTR